MVHFENGLATQVAVRWSSVRKIFGRAKLLLSLISVGSAGASPSQPILFGNQKNVTLPKVRCNSKPAVSVLPLTTLSNKSQLLTDEAWATTKHAIGVQRVATSKTGFDSTIDKRARRKDIA